MVSLRLLQILKDWNLEAANISQLEVWKSDMQPQ
jgi:hypothetical protein